MSECIIGLGNCSKYYLYILGNAIARCIRDSLLDLKVDGTNGGIGLFNFSPILNDHPLIQSFYKYISLFLGGIIVLKILEKKVKNKEVEIQEDEKPKKNIKNKELLGLLIHNKRYSLSKEIPYFMLFLVCLLFVFHDELIKFLYLLNLKGLDFWTFDILFILYFMKKSFPVNLYKHQLYSILFIIITNTIPLVISSFLPYTNHDDSKVKILSDFNTYETVKLLTDSYYFAIFFLLLFISLSFSVSFSRVRTKVFMDFYYIVPYSIIIGVGFIGSILTGLALLIVTFIKCRGDYKGDYCTENKEGEFYYDNFILYYQNIINKFEKSKYYEILMEILVVNPIFFLTNFLGFFFEIMTIYYLNPNYVLIRDNLYYAFMRIIFLLVNLPEEKYKHYLTLPQFFILEITEIFVLFGYSVYLEIIELRFFGLNKDLKCSIILRGKKDAISKPLPDPDDTQSVDEENNNNEDTEFDYNEDNENNENNSIIE